MRVGKFSKSKLNKSHLVINSAVAEETTNAELTSKKRDDLSDSDFALPGRRYPIHDSKHARNALARVSQYGTADEKVAVRKAVHKKFPDIGADDSTNNMAEDEELDSPTESTLTVNKGVRETVRFTVNLSPLKVRHEVLEGRNYTVAPMVMLTEGVHAGSNGPLYYPREELSKTPAVWNHKPVVVYHPTTNDGQATSACDPAVISRRKVGMILNTKFEPGKAGQPGKLKAEAWLETERLPKVDSRVAKAVQNKAMMEVSTGLYTDNEAKTGLFKGKAFDFIARNYRPDHLAILPDEKGACSMADGAGLMRNASGDDPRTKKLLQQAIAKRTLPSTLAGASQSPSIRQMNALFCIYGAGDGKTYKQDYGLDNEGNITLSGSPEEVTTRYMSKDGSILNTQGAPMKTLNHTDMVDLLISNADSPWTDDHREALMDMDTEIVGNICINAGIVHKDGNDYIDDGGDDNSETLCDAEDMVKAKKPGSKKGKQDNMKKSPKKVSNSPKFDDEDTEDDLKGSGKDDGKSMQKNRAQVQVQNQDEEQDVDEFISKAPPEMRELLTNSLRTHNEQKKRLVNQITTNKANKFSREFLMGKSMEELECLAALANTGKPSVKMAQNYSGMGDVGMTEELEQATMPPPLSVPVMNFTKVDPKAKSA